MKPLLGKLLGEATRLTQSNKLVEATAAIQRALGGTPAQKAGATGRAPARRATVLDGLVREVRPAEKSADTPPARPASVASPGAGRFEEGTFTNASGSRAYKLYIPATVAEEPMPLIVMLHGCTQSPDDFAAGTRMNELADERGFLVLYPAQAPRSNSSKCWNWFVPADQRRGGGEPELLAGMTRHIVKSHRVDASRVYIAGLSAGGAMAAIMGSEYPDIFAAIGVHSGLARGAAHDVASAFSAMHSGVPAGNAGGAATTNVFGGSPMPGSSSPFGTSAFSFTTPFSTPAAAPVAAAADPDTAGAQHTPPAVPVIVFHGDRDSTVHFSNGAHVVDAVLGANGGARHGIVSSLENTTAGGRTVTRTVHRKPGAGPGTPSLAEHWAVHGAGHAWSGGSTAGSFTDATGPDASREMVRFFEAHRLQDAAAMTPSVS